MEWDKKRIDTPKEKEESTVDTRSLGIVKKLEHAVFRKSIKDNISGPADCQIRRLTRVALDAQRRKAEAVTLIRRRSFI